jgi:hypothetical protein
MSTILADESITPGVRLQKYYDSLSKLNSFNPTGSLPNDASIKIKPEISDPILKTLNKILELLQPKPKDEAAKTTQETFVKKLSELPKLIQASNPGFKFNSPNLPDESTNKFDSSMYNFNVSNFDPKSTPTQINNTPIIEPLRESTTQARTSNESSRETTPPTQTTTRDKKSNDDDDNTDMDLSSLFKQSESSVNDSNVGFVMPQLTADETTMSGSKTEKVKKTLGDFINIDEMLKYTRGLGEILGLVEKVREIPSNLKEEYEARDKAQKDARNKLANIKRENQSISAINGTLLNITTNDISILENTISKPNRLDLTQNQEKRDRTQSINTSPVKIHGRRPINSNLNSSEFTQKLQQKLDKLGMSTDDFNLGLASSPFSIQNRKSTRAKKPTDFLINNM